MLRCLFLWIALYCGMSYACASGGVTVPKPLLPGDTIAIITPASAVDSLTVVGAKSALESLGFAVRLMPHVHGHYRGGSYAAPDSARASDIMQAFLAPGVKAILCSRGGYGSTRLLPYLDAEAIAANPKWLIGYSDITALHAFMTSQARVASIHGPMCAAFADGPDENALMLSALISGEQTVKYDIAPSEYNKPGSGSGMLVGGNMLVAQGLADTPYDTLKPDGATDGVIIFIEDVGEKIYAIERFLLRLHLSGALAAAKGIVFGEFTEYEGDSDFESMEQMIHTRMKEWGYYDDDCAMPIVFGFPAGHGKKNYPLVMGVRAEVIATPGSACIREL